MKVAICDDNKSALDFIYTTVSKEFCHYGIHSQIVAYSDSRVLLDVQKKDPYDVLFLDISMPDIDGFQIAEEIRKTSKNAIIIFITSKDELVYDSFDYQPFFFIRKNDSDNIARNISRAVEMLTHYIKQNKSIVLDVDGVKMPVMYTDIMYIKSDRHYLQYHMADGDVFKVRGVMKDKDREFCQYDFIKIHQRYIVNLKYVKFVDKRREILILKNGERLEISRNHKNSADEQFTRYLRETL
ncbi:MAG: LytTR family DNA-binding domain-containing protein [Oscillospiraceae bacterium]|nr:LytTR family DNA-binding domain-containing protein [Oscillospiraceae bacterium]